MPQSAGISDVFLSVVRQLKKPVPEIRIFSGDPLEYRKFMRQFYTKVVANSDSHEECMSYLEQYTGGEANRIVSGYSYFDALHGYEAALGELEERYGNQDVIANAFIRKALEWPTLKADDAKGLDNFAIFLAECANAVSGIDAMKVLEFPQNIKRLIVKLPFHYHDRWRTLIQNRRFRGQPITFDALVKFVKEESKKINDPTYGREALSCVSNSYKTSISYRANSIKNFATDTTELTGYMSDDDHPMQVHNTVYSPKDVAFTKPCAYCKNDSHTLESCQPISEIEFQDRISFLQKKGLCYGCLKPGHRRNECRNKKKCSKCSGWHPTICHITKTTVTRNVMQPQSNDTMVSSCTGVVGANSCMGAGDSTDGSTLAILPVKIKMKNGLKVVSTYAFLDPGSSVSFCTYSLLQELGVSGRKMKITLDTMNKSSSMNTSVVEGLQVGDLNLENIIDLPRVYSTDTMPVANCHIPTYQDVAKWPHLQDIIMPQIEGNVCLLIGNNVPGAYTPLELKTGPRGSPHATKTLLGWVAWNVQRDGDAALCHASVNRTHIRLLEDFEHMKALDIKLQKFINYDFPERVADERKELSRDDISFMHKVSDSIVFEKGHYQIDLPFKIDNVQFPDNTYQAMQRLNHLKQKFLRDPKFKEDYNVFMQDIFDKGYAERVPDDEVYRGDKRVWYVPHHGVYHSKKPDKIRVVFDCSACNDGVSLNNMLLSGPDLTNNLISVLLRFRQDYIAIMGDIDAMFFQVRVNKRDCDCLRFLWWPDGNVNSVPVVYRMLVHLFRAVSSPSCSNAALHQTVMDNQHGFSTEVLNSVMKNFYVDDCLKSAPYCRRGYILGSRFEFTLYEGLAKDVKVVDLQREPLPSEQALGVYWAVEPDKLGFSIHIVNRHPCRRSILSIVSSVYDPLGLAAPFILTAKLLLQDLCRQSIGWDDEIPEQDRQRWERWLHELPQLENLEVNRCYKPNGFGRVVTYELHVISDASDVGYGVAVYLRLINDQGQIHCCLVMGKSRVVPLKKITIPRLELTAATVAARISRIIVNELEFPIQKVFFWTDSTSVLGYISNETSRFYTFVANRVSVIRDISEVHQWGYINSKSNPADMASRGIRIEQFLQSKLWFDGPEFLWKDSSEWPNYRKDYSNIISSDPEVKKVNATVVNKSDLDELTLRCGTWLKLRRSVAWIIRFTRNIRFWTSRRRDVSGELKLMEPDKDKCRTLVEHKLQQVRKSAADLSKGQKVPSCLTVEEIQEAENLLVKHVQLQWFPDEITSLQLLKTVSKNSPLYRLDAILVDGLIRVGGRLEHATIQYEAKHPVVLPGKSMISRLILESVHRDVGHLGKMSMLSRVRQMYWILGVNTSIKSLVSKCVLCRKYRAGPGEQKMADLPMDRVSFDDPPFSRTGMDYFGPIEVKRGRTCSLLKRYGVIFTCLSSRAVHLEVAHTLDTNSCINAIRRFVARRGPVRLIRSDNGTNLVGSCKELQNEINNWNLAQISDTLLQRKIQWKFNPPSASHFGGVWERMIRSVKKVLFSLLHQFSGRLDDESLETLFCEVESILNGRPITEMPNAPSDLEALTPNHILLFHGGDKLPPGIFHKTDNYVKKRWKQVQFLADEFWRRWVREYLPLLQEPQKWLRPRHNLKVGDVVLIIDSSPRNAWSLGRVLEAVSDSKGLVRSVKLRTKSGILTRHVDKLCSVLESDEPA